jgi:UDP-2,3-diacylglucosamine pyrophosphatase LpxH
VGANFFSDIASDAAGSRNAGRAFLDLRRGGKVLVVSDLHMGTGPRDDLAQNGELLVSLLKDYYYPSGWLLVLNGDVEELHRYSLHAIRERWAALYRVFDRFASEGRLYKTLGNHDEDLRFEKNYPYPLYHALRIETSPLPVFVYHGHQSSPVFTEYNAILRGLVRYILTPLGIRNVSTARSPHRRFYVEKKAYAFSMEQGCISIIGHTHRALFESLSRFDYVRFEIERFCRDYPSSEGREKKRIAAEVAALRNELRKLKRSERRDVLRQSLYGEELPVPCLFNSGSAISRRGLNAIELDGEEIALVYWFADGNEKKFVTRGNYRIEKLRGTPYRRTVLNRDRLDYIKARMELLGPASAL